MSFQHIKYITIRLAPKIEKIDYEVMIVWTVPWWGVCSIPQCLLFLTFLHQNNIDVPHLDS